MTDILTGQALTDKLNHLSGWSVSEDESAITKTFELADFDAAMVFVNQVAAFAADADHHPDIDIRYNKVSITLSTHSEGGVTEKDISLATLINGAL
jgi:4a-hydroxytetrahydrobiopterin dehydratase